MTDQEFNKLLEDDSQSDAEVSRRRRKRKARDVVCISVCASYLICIFSNGSIGFELALFIVYWNKP